MNYIDTNNNIKCINLHKNDEILYPSYYFNSNDSFFLSFLYLHCVNFPKKSQFTHKKYLSSYLSNLLIKQSANSKQLIDSKQIICHKPNTKKMLKYLFTAGVLTADTDPNFNKYFNILYDLFFTDVINDSSKHIIIVIKTNTHYDNSFKLKFNTLYPANSKKYKFTTTKTNHLAYLILELPNYKYAPFGTTYISE